MECLVEGGGGGVGGGGGGGGVLLTWFNFNPNMDKCNYIHYKVLD